MSPALGELARELINRFQGGFPLAERPYSIVAAKLGTTEAALISLLGQLLEDGYISRFGPSYNAERLGGAVTLAALEVPEARFRKVSDLVSAFPAVAHNYRREHRLNMWFVVAGESLAAVAETLAAVSVETGLEVYDFPKLREFYLGLWIRLHDDGRVDTVPAPPPGRSTGAPLDALGRKFVELTQGGLPLVPEPYAEIARAAGCTVDELLERFRRWLETGVIRRIGALPHHFRLGLRGNGMAVWDVPDSLVGEVGPRLGALEFVSHCYERPRRMPLWPYNLFTMVHGRDRSEVDEKVEAISGQLGEHCRAHDVLYSREVLKKTGLRLGSEMKHAEGARCFA